MCGFVGTLNRNAFNTVSGAQGMRHRGPDDLQSLTTHDAELKVSHVRLSIIDLVASTQPIQSFDKRYTLVFNGEIFNYKELREALDYPFITNGDTETLLAMWVLHQEKCVPLLRGQFSFAVWDDYTKRLSLVVDAFGILPLYVFEDESGIAFGSGVSPLFAGGITPKIDLTKIRNLLTQRSVSAPNTPFLGVQRLAPGEIWHFQDKRKVVTKWVHVPNFKKSKLLFGEKVEVLHELLEQASGRAITADVPIGCFLSGGLDSAIMASLAQARLPYRMKAYTASWVGNHTESELAAATESARSIGLDHVPLQFSSHDWWQALNESAPFRESPHSEPADAIFYLLAQRASQDVKVVVTGEGADELFSGYPKSRFEKYAHLNTLRFGAKILRNLNVKKGDERIHRLILALSKDTNSERWSTYFATLWPDSFHLTSTSKNELHSEGSLLDLMREWDIQHWLSPLLLDRADRMSMAHSLEVRPVFLDYDILQFSRTLDDNDLVHGRKTKFILREVAKRVLPESQANVPKRGFPLPLNSWLRYDLYNEAKDVLGMECWPLDQLISRSQRLEILKEHSLGVDHGRRIFTLMSFQLWLQNLDRLTRGNF